ncbi:MAG: 2-amino-4-hydroxy-6-hydroxymethyldihydropteridine diphosphokinase [Chromatiales bacterium]|jgi:2-amino-4-hydroxy-6-hydroxymethyldihydropteridine diphosphokinase|nr:2-amino-4-hydroxy-6-hydroxymethyldihydropteridine diphosphokinase [Chromatiales bacterium]MDP7270813.1 2-amino-4-hydroxy-6-hydroxymethyldihydropteridine diphosphokinase [Gammaproteobacteria bacterium]HJP04862.1 2-amino-4-hydroxy-6-hydroxymethyldihydropteridine diphosphokinase [Gammaproteobacteria bacterium]
MAEPKHWSPAYVGIGSNLEDPASQVRAALDGLAELRDSRLVAASDLYRNPPLGPRDQPDYVNAAAGLLTRLSPEDLLAELHGLEKRQGRTRVKGDHWGPRIIDLDLLVFGRRIIHKPGLNLPHPGISERNFVLFPLCDIAPTLAVPGQGIVFQLAQQLGDEDLQAINTQTRQRA